MAKESTRWHLHFEILQVFPSEFPSWQVILLDNTGSAFSSQPNHRKKIDLEWHQFWKLHWDRIVTENEKDFHSPCICFHLHLFFHCLSYSGKILKHHFYSFLYTLPLITNKTHKLYLWSKHKIPLFFTTPVKILTIA